MMRALFSTLTHAHVPLVLLALALHVTGLVVTGERWRVVIAALGTRLSLWRTTLVNLAGIFVRNATPTTGLGGDASRIALLRAEGMPLAQATASFAYVRLAELPPLVLVVLISAPAIAAVAERSARALVITSTTLIVCAVALWLMRGTLQTQFASQLERAAHLRIDRTAASLAVAYATLAQAETIARQMVVAAAFGVPLTIEQSATVTAMTIVGGFVPTVGSIGAIDGSMVAGLMLFGASAGDAIAITIVGRAISYGVSTAMGAAALLLLGGRGIVRAVSARKTNTAAAG
jgi:uncharacterized membrane protein YbhN (UPF0104 family)